MTAPITDTEEVCCLFCKARPEVAELRPEGPILVCVSEGECDDRAVVRTETILAELAAKDAAQ
jgi:hypothetical protein